MSELLLPIAGGPAPESPPERAAAASRVRPGEERGRYFVHTWGCQMNVHDSERMAGLLESIGFTAAPDESQADLVLLNTCTVRENAAAKVAGKLGDLKRLKREREHLIVGVTGCFAQQEQSALFDGAPHLDLVLGPRAIPQLPRHVQRIVETREKIADTAPWTDTIGHGSELSLRKTFPKAFLTVQEGCDKFCTYCVVPFTRGREKCRSLETLVAESRELTARGFRELELLGQNVNAFADEDGHDFADLLLALAELPGLERLRFVTSHPKHFGDRIIAAYEHPVLADALHLPVQCGSDRVLAAMQREYTRRDYLARIERLRKVRPDIALQTDLIVGFPGETEADFQETMSLLDEVGFEGVYSFKYSPRPYTKAAKHLPDDVPAEVKQDRLARLQARQDELQAARDVLRVGGVEEVLIEGLSKRSGADVQGRTSRNRVVNLPGGLEWRGLLVPARITEARAHSFRGEAAGPPR